MIPERTPLAVILERRIRETGPVSLATYMALALGDPDYGYYMRNDPFGERPDFVTAPELVQVFGELIGLWCGVVWRAMGSPAPVRLVEMGPGSGALMADALAAVRGVLPDFHAAADVWLVETSPALRARQKATLAAAAPDRTVTWCDALDGVAAGPALIVANELLDALPIHQYVRRPDGWAERHVGLAADDGALAFVDLPMAGTPPDVPPDLLHVPVGSVVEVSPQRLAMTAAIARRVVRDGGGALIIDYGPPVSRAGNSLQALRRSRHHHVLDAPGTCDITSHVDFAAVAGAVADAGARVYGPMAQGDFLSALGARQRRDRLMADKPQEVQLRIAAAVQRLLNPDDMGAFYKALAIMPPGAPPPPPFAP